LDRFTSDVDFRLSNKNNTSQYIDKKSAQDTYAYPDNTSEVDASGGDVEILGTIKNQKPEEEAFEIAKNFQDPENLFKYGKDSLQNLDYTNAEMAFRGFVKKYPNNDKIPNAYYWLGESLFVRENYPEAVLAYGEVIKNHKRHKRASASLLKIALSFSSLGKNKESCDALKKILKQYPDSERDVLKKTNFVIQKNNC
jgi:tol-pal system protein YbgF